MAVLPTKSFNLELTISVPGLISSSSSLPSSGNDQRAFMVRDLDINKVPSGREEYEWIIASMEDEEERFINGVPFPARKKLRLTKQQSCLLEESFRQNHTLKPKQKEALALQLKLRPRQVEVWFQNRRARSKLKQTEMEFDFMKRWFESLTEQNRRLQREVEELRSMKVAPPPTSIPPPSCEPFPATSTLTMCPRCERVTTTTTLDRGSTKTTAAATTTATT